jgi:hypothetical protein
LRRVNDAHTTLIWGFCLGDMFCLGMLKVKGVEVSGTCFMMVLLLLEENVPEWMSCKSFMFTLFCSLCFTLVSYSLHTSVLFFALPCSLLTSVFAFYPVLYSSLLF